jgi:predicted dehydrogenase
MKAALAASTVTIVPSFAAPGSAPSEKVNLACIGVGNQASGDIKTFNQCGIANFVAFCDVDIENPKHGAIFKLAEKAPHFSDFREMFDKMAKDIDAVMIAVPDHSHFPASMLAMSQGKHVFVEKPMAHRFEEIELMMACARKNKVATQMGNQGHSEGNYFQFKAWTEAGLMDSVTKVDAFMNSPRRWHGWKVDGFPTGEPMPKGLNWDVWLGPRPETPFSKELHPGNWRSWYRFGNGAFGDWGPHILDTAHEFLQLGLPQTIEAVKREGPSDFIFPQASTIRFDFPVRGKFPAIEVFWYDGVKNTPPRPKELEADRKLAANGKLIYSKDNIFLGGTHGATLRIIPEAKMKDLTPKLPKVAGKNSNHYLNYLLGCKGQETCRSNFDVAGPLTQVFLLGVIAQHLGGKLEFDREKKQITNNAEANKLLVGDPPRKGWEQFYKL